ncbi:MAG: hypothetical protein QW590_00675 [Candidatus Bilamarchaeaceae archaeon]
MTGIDVVFDSIKEGWQFAEKNFIGLFKKILTIHLLAAVVLIAGILITALLGLGIYELLGPLGVLVALLAAIPLTFLVSVAATTVQSIVYNVVNKWPAPIGINETFNKNLKPVLFYSLAMTAIGIIVIIIELVIVFVIGLGMGMVLYTIMDWSTASGMIDLLNALLRYLIDLTIKLIIGFLFQFVLFELIITRMGVLESLKKSIDIALKNFVPTIVFDIFVGLLEGFILMVLAVPLIILLMFAAPVFVLMLPGISTGALSVAEWAIIGVAVLIVLAALTVIVAIATTVTLPMKYTYWRKVRGK